MDKQKALETAIANLKESLNKTILEIKSLNLTEDEGALYTQGKRVQFDAENLLESAAVRTDVEEFADLYGSDDYYSSSLDC